MERLVLETDIGSSLVHFGRQNEETGGLPPNTLPGERQGVTDFGVAMVFVFSITSVCMIGA